MKQSLAKAIFQLYLAHPNYCVLSVTSRPQLKSRQERPVNPWFLISLAKRSGTVCALQVESFPYLRSLIREFSGLLASDPLKDCSVGLFIQYELLPQAKRAHVVREFLCQRCCVVRAFVEGMATHAQATQNVIDVGAADRKP